ncbi:hypothetical protein EIP86_007186 [Pleurotus ostreatoroseus]|nr:hypothetical protein EIP86_007186 [Pleurotus ostreatoroseus]
MAARYSLPSRPPLCSAPQPKASPFSITRNYLEEDYLAVWDDPGGSSSSDSESDSEMDSVTKPKSRPQPTSHEEKPRAQSTNTQSGLKIVIPARKYNTGLVAKHTLSDEFDDPDEDDEDQDMHYTNDAEDEYMLCAGDEDVDMNYEGDAEGEDENMSFECDDPEEPPPSPTKIRKAEYCSARSPLSASSKAPVYAGFYCTIEGCRFTASTAQHLRHHIATAQHGRHLRAAYTGPA